jgi:hypothetical protein
VSIEQPSAIQAMGRISYNADGPYFLINRGFKSVERYNIPPGPGPAGCVILKTDEGITPKECIVQVTAITDIPNLGPDVLPQFCFNYDGERWNLLVITATPDGSADIDFMIDIKRIN